MNYGKKSVSKKRNSLISRTAMMGKRAHVSLIRVLFVALITICVVIGCTGIGAFRGIIDNAPDANDIDISPLGYATFLYDGDGNQLRKLTAPSSNRLPVSIDQIPLDLQHAVVAIEDERFYEHNGIDVRGILRAFVKNITSGDLSEGASTITQQLLWQESHRIRHSIIQLSIRKQTPKDVKKFWTICWIRDTLHRNSMIR